MQSATEKDVEKAIQRHSWENSQTAFSVPRCLAVQCLMIYIFCDCFSLPGCFVVIATSQFLSLSTCISFRLQGFAFVGLTDHFDLSVCLFHATLSLLVDLFGLPTCNICLAKKQEEWTVFWRLSGCRTKGKQEPPDHLLVSSAQRKQLPLRPCSAENVFQWSGFSCKMSNCARYAPRMGPRRLFDLYPSNRCHSTALP